MDRGLFNWVRVSDDESFLYAGFDAVIFCGCFDTTHLYRITRCEKLDTFLILS